MQIDAKNAAQADALETDDYHQFTIVAPMEINQVLHAIMRRAGLITASLGINDFFLTSIISIDDDTGSMLIECERNSRNSQRVISKQRLLCSTTLDKIKIQFVSNHIELIKNDGQDAFRIALPRSLMRLQRREYFRIAAPIITPVKCIVSIPQSEMSATVELNLIDISCGGIAVLTPPALFTPELGAYYDCLIHLPGVSPLQTRTEARNAFVIKLVRGKIAHRAGFAFVNLPENMLAAIQRYIMTLERQRNARGSDH